MVPLVVLLFCAAGAKGEYQGYDGVALVVASGLRNMVAGVAASEDMKVAIGIGVRHRTGGAYTPLKNIITWKPAVVFLLCIKNWPRWSRWRCSVDLVGPDLRFCLFCLFVMIFCICETTKSECNKCSWYSW